MDFRLPMRLWKELSLGKSSQQVHTDLHLDHVLAWIHFLTAQPYSVHHSPIWKIYHVIDISRILLFTMPTSSRRRSGWACSTRRLAALRSGRGPFNLVGFVYY